MTDVTINLADRVAVVTGAAFGFGRAICDCLLKAGAQVFGCDVVPATDEMGGGLTRLDLLDRKAVASWAAGVERDAHGPAEIRVNNAGGTLGLPRQPMEDLTDDDWDSVVDVNLGGSFAVCRAFARDMKSAGKGSIVNIASGAGLRASLTGIQAYCSAKHGVIGLTRQLADELGPYGVRVNALAPGLVLNDSGKQARWEGYPEQKRQAVLQGVALRRPGTNQDIANAVLFLASDMSDWITGQVLPVDGGVR